MKASFQQDYPASVEKLWQIFGDPEYPHKKYRALGISAYEVHQFDVSGTRISLDMTRTLSIPPDRIPALVQRFLHPEQALRYVSSWNRITPEHADFVLEIIAHGLPIHVRASGTLRQADSNHSSMALEFDVRASIPLLGGKIETMVIQQIEKSFRADHAYTLQYLAENS